MEAIRATRFDDLSRSLVFGGKILKVGFGNKQKQAVIALMEDLILKIKDLEREALRLKQQESSLGKALPPQQPLLRQWSLEKKQQQQQQQQQSLPRPTAARSLQILEKGLGSHSAVTVARSLELEEPFEGDGDGNWLAAFKAKAGRWTGRKLVVLSLFDGIGGIWAALTRLGIPFVGYSAEIFDPAIQVVRAKFPEVRHVGDVRRLAKPAIREEIDLIVGGFPCQDLSCLGKKEGLHGSRSKLFFDLARVLRDFNPRWFLVENVASMTWIDREEISKYLGLLPIELDSIELSPTRRRRLYWTNIPHPPKLPRVRDHPSTLVQSCLHDAIALEEKTGVVLSNNDHEGNNCQLELVMEKGTDNLRYLNHVELELIMGYPPHHTNILLKEGACSTGYSSFDLNEDSCNIPARGKKKGGFRCLEALEFEPLKAAIRWRLLGNAFTVQVISYLLSPLLWSSIRELSRRIQLPGPFLEKECSVMEPNDVWALYNQHERPNWYALIIRRTGDRFSRKNQKTGKKLPLCIEMQYMELVPYYLQGEEDTWNPLRGTGLYEVRGEVDFQDSWTAFSHRVTSCRQLYNRIFIYPGKDELWSVYSRRTWSPFFVYVIESSVNINNLEVAAHAHEEFYARGWVVIKTGENETYRITDKVLEFFDLSIFCFRAPYHFKLESHLLKVEVGLKGRKKLRKIESMIRQTRKRKRGKTSSFDEEEEEEGDEEEEIDEVIKERDVFLDDALVEEPDHSGNNYLMSNNDDPPFRPSGDVGDADNGVSTPETIVLDDDYV